MLVLVLGLGLGLWLRVGGEGPTSPVYLANPLSATGTALWHRLLSASTVVPFGHRDEGAIVTAILGIGFDAVVVGNAMGGGVV